MANMKERKNMRGEPLSRDVNIHYDTKCGKWVVRVMIHDIDVYKRRWHEIGRFDTKQAAVKRAQYINK